MVACRGTWPGVGALLLGAAAAADVWTEPSPFRPEALIEGRDYIDNAEAFLHRLSYRHRSREPASHQDGVRATLGSVTGDELFIDLQLQKTLWFDDGRHAAFVRLQRFEDFDGDFSRELIGLRRRLGEHWEIAAAGDVRLSKAAADIQLEASWQPDDARLLRLAYVRPEWYRNTKGDGTLRYRHRPQTFFGHYRQRADDGGYGEIAVSHSPRARLERQEDGLLAAGRQTRVMSQGAFPFAAGPAGEARLGGRVEVENADRSFDWTLAPAADAGAFQRRMRAADVYVELTDRRWAPTFGYRWFRLREHGWFGENLATTGEVRRDEHLVYLGARIRTGPRQVWEPTLYGGHVDANGRFPLRPRDDRDRSRWLGKLALPWRYTVHEASGAVLTVNLTVRLHTAAFGGGNVQLHWPL